MNEKEMGMEGNTKGRGQGGGGVVLVEEHVQRGNACQRQRGYHNGDFKRIKKTLLPHEL